MYFFKRFFESIVVRKNTLQLELICLEAYNFLCTVMYNNPKTKYRNLYKMLEFVDVHCHGVLIFKKGSMEVDSAIEALDLTL